MALEIPQFSLKRDHDSFNEKCSGPVDQDSISHTQSNDISDVHMDVLPSSILTSANISTAPSILSTTENPAPINQPPLKKAKILENNKQSKDPSKAEEKLRKEKLKEAERQRKDIERKKKEAEREEKRAAQEAEKQAREEKRRKIEEDKRKKEEEKLKKERNQLKLGCFFALPVAAGTPHANSLDTKRCNGLDGTSNNDTHVDGSSTVTSITSDESQLTPYYKLFPEFFIQNGVTLAPVNRIERNEEELRQVQENIDRCINGTSQVLETPSTVREILKLSDSDMRARGKRYKSIRSIMEDFYSGKSTRLNDLSPCHSTDQHNLLLHSIPMKSLKFYEDVRPPYIGTFTSYPTCSTMKLARNPLRKNLPHIDYDYDSEAEWVEDEDGEELKSDEEEEELDDDEDIEGFLDDENDDIFYSRKIVVNGDLVPISSGLCWEDENMCNQNSDMAIYRMEFILDSNVKSIDPFLSSYWTSPHTSEASSKMLDSSENISQRPKSLLSISEKYLSFKFAPTTPVQSAVTKSSKKKDIVTTVTTKQLIANEDMKEFKLAVEGSDLSKIGLIEVLKKKFPGRPAATIKATLEVIAKRGQKGQKEADKRWVLVDSPSIVIS